MAKSETIVYKQIEKHYIDMMLKGPSFYRESRIGITCKAEFEALAKQLLECDEDEFIEIHDFICRSGEIALMKYITYTDRIKISDDE